MIRTKGEAGTGDIVNAVTHMRSVFGGIRRLHVAARARSSTRRRRSCARRTSSCGGSPRTAGCRSSRSPPAASRRRPTRRSACSSAPTASSSAPASSSRATPTQRAQGDRRGDDALPGRRRSSPASRPASASRWSASRRSRSIRASCSRRAAGSRRPRLRPPRSTWIDGLGSAFSPCRAPSASTRRCCARSAPTSVEVRTPEQLDGLDGARHPRRRVDDDHAPDAASTGSTRRSARSRRPIFGTCAGMIVLDREHLGLVDIAVERNAFGRQVASFETDLDVDGRATSRSAASSSARRGSRRSGPGVEVLAEVDGAPGARARGPRPRRVVPSRADRRHAACTSGSWSSSREEQGVRA